MCIRDRLKAKSAVVRIFDPYYPGFSTHKSLEDTLANSQAAVIVTAHKEFLDETLYRTQKVVLDGRNCLDKLKFSKSEGPVYIGIGIAG